MSSSRCAEHRICPWATPLGIHLASRSTSWDHIDSEYGRGHILAKSQDSARCLRVSPTLLEIGTGMDGSIRLNCGSLRRCYHIA